MSELTKEQAIALSESKFWEGMSHRDIAVFQMEARLLCMPFGVFHEAIEKALGRGVFTHEFGFNWEGLKRELYGEASAPSLEDVLALIPEGKRVVVVTPGRKAKKGGKRNE